MTLKIGANGSAVRDLQQKLNVTGANLVVDGWYGEATAKAVEQYQQQQDLPKTGYAGERTLALLAGASREKFISGSALAASAASLKVELAAMAAVAEVESSGSGFFSCGRPVILFERHVFYRQINAKDPKVASELASKYPNICNQSRGGYTGGSGEYQRFAIAHLLDPEAAICSCSWGMFQIMGFHWQTLGYSSAQDFRRAMDASEIYQLDALARFIRIDSGMLKALRDKKWPEFARRYNGPAYKDNDYDIKLARAYQRFCLAYPQTANADVVTDD